MINRHAHTSPGFKNGLWEKSSAENKWSINPYIHKGKKFFIGKGINFWRQGGEWEYWRSLQWHPDFIHGALGQIYTRHSVPLSSPVQLMLTEIGMVLLWQRFSIWDKNKEHPELRKLWTWAKNHTNLVPEHLQFTYDLPATVIQNISCRGWRDLEVYS